MLDAVSQPCDAYLGFVTETIDERLELPGVTYGVSSKDKYDVCRDELLEIPAMRFGLLVNLNILFLNAPAVHVVQKVRMPGFHPGDQGSTPCMDTTARMFSQLSEHPSDNFLCILTQRTN